MRQGPAGGGEPPGRGGVRAGPTAPPVLRALALAALVAGPALAQDVEGTWELTAAENVPYEDDLVFARLTFADGDLRRTFVLLDPDDGELIGQIEDARYLRSDGQLVVRDGRDVTVLDVVRDGDRLTVRDLETGVVLRLRAADPGGALDAALLGAWRAAPGAAGGRGGGLALRFLADGSVEVESGSDRDTERYVVAGPYLLVGDEPVRYGFARDAAGRRQLRLEGEGGATVLDRESPDD